MGRAASLMKRSQNITLEAFTLVELVVVLGVVALMAALVLPEIARAKQAKRRIQCTDNLKQLDWNITRSPLVCPGSARWCGIWQSPTSAGFG